MIGGTNQENINLVGDGDVVGRDKKEIHYHYGTSNNTKLKVLFDSLYNEVQKDEKLKNICEELTRYLTDKDTIGLEKKLQDGGYGSDYILDAIEQKEIFAKKLYRFQEYESAQYIYVELLALIKTNFQDFIYPLIQSESDKVTISHAIREHIINPIIRTLSLEGAQDTVLNLNAEEVRGMLYYLTGRCHIKWTYDSI